jgi:hypothetical protein
MLPRPLALTPSFDRDPIGEPMARWVPALLVAAALLQGGAARAERLDAEGCARLKGELALLEQAGVRATLAKGAEWGKANLAADKLGEVRRLIELDEQLLFRCQGKPLVLLPVTVDQDLPPKTDDADDGKEPAAKDKTGDEQAKTPPAVKKAAAKPADKAPAAGAKDAAPPKKAPAAAKPATKPGDKAAAVDAKEVPAAKKAPAAKAETPARAKGEAAPGPGKDGAGQKAAAKPKPKAKVDDAYRPPQPGDASADPFGGQGAPAGK